ncbi:DoxX family protein [halophilic archaeon]|nr:DoxX family protein [halophilic archaeon]
MMNESNAWGPVPIRFAVGLIMVVHGLGKVFGMGPAALPIPKFTGFLAGLGIPAAPVVAWIVALIEVGGGILVFVGLFTRVAALLVAGNMLVATFLVHLPNGFSDAELTIVLCLASFSLVVSGAGRLSIREIMADGSQQSFLSAVQ